MWNIHPIYYTIKTTFSVRIHGGNLHKLEKLTVTILHIKFQNESNLEAARFLDYPLLFNIHLIRIHN